jgi:hypothetical protein
MIAILICEDYRTTTTQFSGFMMIAQYIELLCFIVGEELMRGPAYDAFVPSLFLTYGIYRNS